MAYAVQIDKLGHFRDASNRVITLRGINLAADSKLPATPAVPSHVADNFFDGDNVSYVGRPFPLAEADAHLTRIRSWGFNVIRYVYTWEALEHAGPGKYDEAFIDFTIIMLKKIKQFGFYVYMDPHQDAWSRFSGGSGAPMWTLYAAGLDPTTFSANEAALVQNTWPDPGNFPRMTWATNYERCACATMFTLFFAGRDFAPKAIIDGMNIQDYLSKHFLAATQHLAERMYADSAMTDDFVLGWESWNEPNRGYLGIDDITVFPADSKLRVHTSPTPFEGMRLASGRTVDVPVFGFGAFGPYKVGMQAVNVSATSSWLSPSYDDSRYGWRRDAGWALGECIWAQHGVWDPETDTVLKKDYFRMSPDGTFLSDNRWADKYFIAHWEQYATMIRRIRPQTILFCQTPVMAFPPNFRELGKVLPRMVFTPHFYDGLTLIRKHWSRIWNIDVVGVLRGKYWSPVFAMRFGETAIRNSLRDQLRTLKAEGVQQFGVGVPCLFSEVGIPFDMNDKKAYIDGDYDTQIRALDANIAALEGAQLHHTYWVYSALNSHKWGDQWNGEDLSLFSQSDLKHQYRAPSDYSTSSDVSLMSKVSDSVVSLKEYEPITDILGGRAIEAFVRPFPLLTSGIPRNWGFDLRTATFSMDIDATEDRAEDLPTEIHVPDFHFPNGDLVVEISTGRWELDHQAQLLRWWHMDGRQSIRIIGICGEQRVVKEREAQDWNDFLCSSCSE
ncbi:glycoside hydrolase superfamily [Limtongia smithiae]|uniref:glycoside hydrolase superfamily n=1 Tax=Limtongia smithiae TaxID=1125753 RepID=UPI0034CEA911